MITNVNVLLLHISNGTKSDDLCIRIATVGNTIQTVNSPMYDTYKSTPGNTSKLGTAHSNIQTAQSCPSLVGSEPTMQYIFRILLSQHINPPSQPGMNLLYRQSFLLIESFQKREDFLFN